MPEEKEHPLYRILFMQNDSLYEIYARYLTEESLMGFIEVEELVFQDVKSTVLVDPAEEKLRAEFKGVKRSYIPLHAIIRIDELMKEKHARSIFSTKTKKGNISHLSFKNSTEGHPET